MKQAIIDIGSNSIRLTVYQITESSFKSLFRAKIMAGLAGYATDGTLSAEGIECACRSLLEFKDTLKSLNIKHVRAFATASLRNISNTEEAVATIKEETGFTVEILSGEEEALLGYYGAMRELSITDGSYIDIGGASTEIVSFKDCQPQEALSCAIGSLNLYRRCVKKILPSTEAIELINQEIEAEIHRVHPTDFTKRSPLVCAGGTARGIAKMARRQYNLPADCMTVTAEQIEGLYEILIKRDRTALNLILRVVPDRTHTIIPGILIMRQLLKLFKADRIVVTNYGVKEGYLYKNILTSHED